MEDIQFLKPNYKNPRPILYRYFGEPEVSLTSKDFNRATNIEITEDVNESGELTFDVPFLKDRKVDHTSNEKLIWFEDKWYVIKSVNINDSDTKTTTVSCKEYCDVLKGIYCDSITKIGCKPREIFDAIVESAKFTTNASYIGFQWLGDDVDKGVYRHLVTENETSVFQNLVDMAEVFNGWLEFTYDEDGQGYVFLRTKEIDEDKFIKKNLDMKELSITSDSSEIFTHYFAEGKEDEYGIRLDVQEAPSNKSHSAIISDHSYYQAMGIPDEIIAKEPMYNQLKSTSDDTYTDAEDLYLYAKEELAKCCKPKIDADVKMSDLSVYIDSPIVPPRVGMKLRCIDKDINFIFDCKIIGVTRNYENPVDTTIRISNVIPYSTSCGDMSHVIDVVGSVTSSDPTDTDGNVVGNGDPYVKGQDVLDGDHINVIRRVGDVQSNIYATNEQAGIRVEQINKTFAEIQVNADSINSTVEELNVSMSNIEQKSNSITSTVRNLSNASEETYSQIVQLADGIKTKVSKGQMGSMIEQYPESVKVSWNQNSKYATLDDDEGLILGDTSSGSYSKIGYDGRLAMQIAGQPKPYHCISVTGNREIYCTNADYTSVSFPLPSIFNGIADEDIKVMVSTQKVYKEGNEYLGHWSGSYGEIRNRQVVLHGLATFRYPNYGYTEDNRRFVESFSSPQAGNIIISYMIIA